MEVEKKFTELRNRKYRPQKPGQCKGSRLNQDEEKEATWIHGTGGEGQVWGQLFGQ